MTPALPQPVQEPPAPATLKHPLPQPAQQGPPNKQGRSKEFPRDRQGKPIVPLTASPAVDLANVGAPTPKDPPASFMPTPQEVRATQPTSSCAAAALPGEDVQMARATEAYGQKKRIQYVRSPSDIDWDCPLRDQLEPQMHGGPNPKRSKDDLRLLHSQIPKLDDKGFKAIFPGEEHSIICVVQKNYSSIIST